MSLSPMNIFEDGVNLGATSWHAGIGSVVVEVGVEVLLDQVELAFLLDFVDHALHEGDVVGRGGRGGGGS